MRDCDKIWGWRLGYSMVEVLVVVAVMGILVTVLVPVVRSSVERADFVESGVGLKSAGVALGLYLADHNMTFPAFRAGPGNSGQYWRIRLAEYLVEPEGGDGADGAAVDSEVYKRVFWSRGYLKAAGLASAPEDVAIGNGSHMINWFFARFDTDGPFPGGVIRRLDSRVIGRREPYMVDGALGSNAGGRGGNTRFTTSQIGVPGSGWADYFGGRVNALYLDGSVRTLGADEAEAMDAAVRDRSTLQ